MKTATKTAAVGTALLLPVLAAEIYSEINYIFGLIIGRGNKLELSKCADLSLEENAIKEEDKYEGENIRYWKKHARHTQCYVKGYNGTAIYCKVYLQKEYADKWVLVVHGYGGNGDIMDYASKKYYDKGYNVVIPDLRGHGKSQGKYIGMGKLDKEDISEIIKLIIKGNPNAVIILHGVSMGGAAVIMAAAENRYGNIKAVISDCSFDRADNIISYQISHNFHIMPYPIVKLLDIICRHRAGYSLRESSPVGQVSKINVPVLFIHGEKDRLVPFKTVHKLYKRAKCKKDLFICHNAGHGVSAFVDRINYWNKIFSFLEKSA